MTKNTLHTLLFDIGNAVVEDMKTIQRCYKKLDGIAKFYAMKRQDNNK